VGWVVEYYLDVAVIDAEVQIGNDKLDRSQIAVWILGCERCDAGRVSRRAVLIQVVIPLAIDRL
jgi:hypothetical protein